MINVDKYENFEWSKWKFNRKFIHLETNEIVHFRGLVVDPLNFESILSFVGKSGLHIKITTEAISDLLENNNPDGFQNLEKCFNLRPLSVGKHNFKDENTTSKTKTSSTGDICQDTDTGKYMVYDGASWVDIV